MFEKQQKRMNNYTKESNGSANITCASPSAINESKKEFEETTKKNMSHVVGEFKKVSLDSKMPVILAWNELMAN